MGTTNSFSLLSFIAIVAFAGCRNGTDSPDVIKEANLIDASVSNSPIRLDAAVAIARSEVSRISPVEYDAITNYTGFSNGVWHIWLWERGRMVEGGVRVSISTNGDVIKMVPDLREIWSHPESYE